MRCIYADPDNLNKFNKSDSGLLAQMYLQLSKSGSALAGSGTSPKDRRGGSDSGDTGVGALSTATYGYRIDTLRR